MPITLSRIDGRISLDGLSARPLFFFDLEPVLERAGPTMLRNPARLEIVCEHCIRAVTQFDAAIFTATGFYLVVTSCNEPQATQLACHISAALLKCFFGAADAPIEELTALFRRPSAAEVSPLAAAVESAAPAQSATDDAIVFADEAPAAPFKGDPLDELERRGVNTRAGFRLGFAPVHDLRKGTLPTFFCMPVRLADREIAYQRDGFAGIGPREFPRFDRAMLGHTLAFSRRLNGAGIVAAVGASVSFETLASSRGRSLYLEALRKAQCANNPYLIVKIDMIAPGTPYVRLLELVSVVRPLAKRVFVHLPESDLAVIEQANLGAAGYVLSSRPGMTYVEIAAQCLRFAKSCNALGALSCVDRIPDDTTADLVRTAGVRFGEGRFLGSRNFFDDTPLSDIAAYRAVLPEKVAAPASVAVSRAPAADSRRPVPSR